MSKCKIIPFNEAVGIYAEKKNLLKIPVSMIARNLLEEYDAVSVILIVHNKITDSIDTGSASSNAMFPKYSISDVFRFLLGQQEYLSTDSDSEN